DDVLIDPRAAGGEASRASEADAMVVRARGRAVWRKTDVVVDDLRTGNRSGLGEDEDAEARVDRAVVAVTGNDIAARPGETPDRRVRRVADLHTTDAVTQPGRTAGVGADEVAINLRAIGAGGDDDAVAGVGGNDVAATGRGAADRVVGGVRVDRHARTAIASGDAAADIDAEEVALDHVVRRVHVDRRDREAVDHETANRAAGGAGVQRETVGR